MSWFVVDVESDGPIPTIYSMVCFGAVRVDDKLDKTFYGQTAPISAIYDEKALSISGFSREQHKNFDEPKKVMEEFAQWLKDNSKGRPIMISDNCLKYSTRIIVDKSFSHLKSYKKRNNTVEIYDIIKNKIDLPIPTYNFKTKKIEFKKIIKWYDNNYEDYWVKIKTNLNNNVPSYTKSHLLYVDNKGWVRADNICIGDTLLQIDTQPNEDQKQLLLGSLLGDATLNRREKRGRSWIIGHNNSQYVEYKFNILKELTNTNSTIKKIKNNRGFSSDNGILYIFRTKTLRFLSKNSKNDLLSIVEKLNYIGLTFWYLDDGSYNEYETKNGMSGYVRLHTEGIEYNILLKIKQILDKKTNLNWKIVLFGRGKYLLSLSVNDSDLFFKKIFKYIPQCMSYKIHSKYHKDIQKYNWNLTSDLTVFKEKVVKTTIENNSESKRYRKRNYCIDVEDNHNFFTTTGLVHNCAYDWQWINYYFHVNLGYNPFGYSGRRIGDLYCGMMNDSFAKWKHLRETKHNHNPVQDAKGNAEVILKMKELGLKIPKK